MPRASELARSAAIWRLPLHRPRRSCPTPASPRDPSPGARVRQGPRRASGAPPDHWRAPPAAAPAAAPAAGIGSPGLERGAERWARIRPMRQMWWQRVEESRGGREGDARARSLVCCCSPALSGLGWPLLPAPWPRALSPTVLPMRLAACLSGVLSRPSRPLPRGLASCAIVSICSACCSLLAALATLALLSQGAAIV